MYEKKDYVKILTDQQFSKSLLKHQKFFSITKTIFSYSRSEQFWQQNTIASLEAKNVLDKFWKLRP